MTEGYDKELEKLELQQNQLRDQQEKGQWDRYNSVDEKVDQDDFRNMINSSLDYVPKQGQTWKEYASNAKIYSQINAKINIKTHIEAKRQWYTHRSPLGCFMCNDTTLISVLVKTLTQMASVYPQNRF